MRVLSLLALAAPLVSAIQFEEPIANSTLKKGETYSVKWSSVDTDPTTFSIFLVNFVDWPPFYTQVASDVQTSEGEHQVTVPCDVNTSWGFQFNAINGTNVYVIHAQTPKFYVRDGACTGAGPNTPVSTCSPVTMTTTTTSTVTVSPSCSFSSEPVTSSATTANPTSATTVAVPSDKPSATTAKPESTVVPPKPNVTTPPSVDDVQQATTRTGTTSTIYHTVYKDMSEVEDHCEQLCQA
ncbi:hypothetical protein VTI74DRAFT_5002 [Chaetomium olivicolor]